MKISTLILSGLLFFSSISIAPTYTMQPLSVPEKVIRGVLGACFLTVAYKHCAEIGWALGSNPRYWITPWNQRIAPIIPLSLNVIAALGFCAVSSFVLGIGSARKP